MLALPRVSTVASHEYVPIVVVFASTRLPKESWKSLASWFVSEVVASVMAAPSSPAIPLPPLPVAPTPVATPGLGGDHRQQLRQLEARGE